VEFRRLCLHGDKTQANAQYQRPHDRCSSTSSFPKPSLRTCMKTVHLADKGQYGNKNIRNGSHG
jgi:hypothetical protein